VLIGRLACELEAEALGEFFHRDGIWEVGGWSGASTSVQA
jgi:hypothetical protein